jgi:DNA replication protein DnaC
VPQVGTWFNVYWLYHAGLASPEKSDKRMYCRQDTRKLLDALDQMEKGILIKGPGGVGKSATVWYWVCQQARTRGQSVLWVHVAEWVSSTIVRLTTETFSSRVMCFSYEDTLSALRQSKDDIVVLDGVTRNDYHETFGGGALWFSNNDRRAIIVASM